MKSVLFILLFVLSSSSYSATAGKWVFDSLSSIEKKQIRASFSYLMKRDVKLSVRSIYNKYNLDTSKGNDIYKLIFKNFKTVIGEATGTKICSKDKGYNSTVPKCENKTKGLLLKKPSIIYMPGSYLAVWDIARDLKRLGVKAGAFVLTNGGYLEVNDSNSKILIYLSKSVHQDGEPLAIKIVSEAFGYSIISELMAKNIKPFSKCEYLIDTYTCQDNELGYFEPVGDLLMDMATTCLTCTEGDVLKIKYWSLNNLSRFNGTKSKMKSIFLSYLKLSDDMKQKGLDIDFLKDRYHQNLVTGR